MLQYDSPARQCDKRALLYQLHILYMVQLCEHRLNCCEVLHRVCNPIICLAACKAHSEPYKVYAEVDGQSYPCSLASVSISPGICLADTFTNLVLLPYAIAPDTGYAEDGVSASPCIQESAYS